MSGSSNVHQTLRFRTYPRRQAGRQAGRGRGNSEIGAGHRPALSLNQLETLPRSLPFLITQPTSNLCLFPLLFVRCYLSSDEDDGGDGGEGRAAGSGADPTLPAWTLSPLSDDGAALITGGADDADAKNKKKKKKNANESAKAAAAALAPSSGMKPLPLSSSSSSRRASSGRRSSCSGNTLGRRQQSPGGFSGEDEDYDRDDEDDDVCSEAGGEDREEDHDDSESSVSCFIGDTYFATIGPHCLPPVSPGVVCIRTPIRSECWFESQVRSVESINLRISAVSYARGGVRLLGRSSAPRGGTAESHKYEVSLHNPL